MFSCIYFSFSYYLVTFADAKSSIPNSLHSHIVSSSTVWFQYTNFVSIHQPKRIISIRTLENTSISA